MRVLVACDDEALRVERAAALVRLEMEAVSGCSLGRVHLEARTAQPDLVLIDGIEAAADARRAIERARNATGRALGALILLPDGATWLRVPLPPDVRPAVVLASSAADDASLARALDELRVAVRVPTGTVEKYGLTFDRRSREARVNDQRVRLTAEEGAALVTLMERPSQIVRRDDLTRAIVGRPLSDPRTRATVEGHLASLHRKLDGLGVGEQLQAVRDLGYRWVERRGRPRPPR